MTVDLVLPALAEIEREIANPFVPGTFTFAYDKAPFSIQQTPSWVNLPGPATYDINVGGEDELGIEVIETRTYTCTLYVIPQGEGAEGEAFAKCEPFFDPSLKTFLAHPALKLTNGIIQLSPLGDDGTKGNLSYAGQFYYGIPFRVQVVARTRSLYADNE
jgi:hypothetical protein